MAPVAAEPMTAWLGANVKSIGFNGQGLTPEKLNYQARCYLATREIVAEKGLDFVAIKCMPDLSNNYVPQCLSASFLPSPYDADGAKEPVAMAVRGGCRRRGSTMQVLKHVSGGVPPFFGDLSYLNESTHTLYLPNCGAVWPWYAGRSDVPAENLMHIELRPASARWRGHYILQGGARAHDAGRLFRRAGKYMMAIIPGEAVAPTDEEYVAFVAAVGRINCPLRSSR